MVAHKTLRMNFKFDAFDKKNAIYRSNYLLHSSSAQRILSNHAYIRTMITTMDFSSSLVLQGLQILERRRAILLTVYNPQIFWFLIGRVVSRGFRPICHWSKSALSGSHGVWLKMKVKGLLKVMNFY